MDTAYKNLYMEEIMAGHILNSSHKQYIVSRNKKMSTIKDKTHESLHTMTP